jgi:hypothetical protein
MCIAFYNLLLVSVRQHNLPAEKQFSFLQQNLSCKLLSAHSCIQFDHQRFHYNSCDLTRSHDIFLSENQLGHEACALIAASISSLGTLRVLCLSSVSQNFTPLPSHLQARNFLLSNRVGLLCSEVLDKLRPTNSCYAK